MVGRQPDELATMSLRCRWCQSRTRPRKWPGSVAGRLYVDELPRAWSGKPGLDSESPSLWLALPLLGIRPPRRCWQGSFKKRANHLAEINAEVLPCRSRSGISTICCQDELLERLPRMAHLIDYQARKVVGEQVSIVRPQERPTRPEFLDVLRCPEGQMLGMQLLRRMGLRCRREPALNVHR